MDIFFLPLKGNGEKDERYYMMKKKKKKKRKEKRKKKVNKTSKLKRDKIDQY